MRRHSAFDNQARHLPRQRTAPFGSRTLSRCMFEEEDDITIGSDSFATDLNALPPEPPSGRNASGNIIAPAMHDEQWKLWKPLKHRSESLLLRYGVAVMLPVIAAVLIHVRPAFADAAYFIFLGVVVLSAVNGGLAPAFVSTALSALLLRILFVGARGGIHLIGDSEEMERMGGFVLVSLLITSFVAGLRRERNHLYDSEERYRILAESASDAIVVIDEHGEIIYTNRASEKLFGAKAELLLGQNLDFLLPGKIYHEQLSELKHRLDTRKHPVAVQLPGRHHSGEHLLVEMTLGSSSHRGKSVFTAIIRDITRHRRRDSGPVDHPIEQTTHCQ